MPAGAPTTDDDDDDGRVAWLGTTDDDEDAGRFAWRPEEPLALWESGEGLGYRGGSGVIDDEGSAQRGEGMLEGGGELLERPQLSPVSGLGLTPWAAQVVRPSPLP